MLKMVRARGTEWCTISFPLSPRMISIFLSLLKPLFRASGWSEACNDVGSVCVNYCYSRQTAVCTVSLPLPKGKLSRRGAEASLPPATLVLVFFPFPTSLSRSPTARSLSSVSSGHSHMIIPHFLKEGLFFGWKWYSYQKFYLLQRELN